MKGNHLLSLLGGVCMTFFLLSCNKEDVKLNNGSPVFTIKSLFENIKTKPQLFTVIAGQNQIVEGTAGTKLLLHPGTFTNAQGQLLDAGTIQLELTEIYKPADMIANRVYTTTSNNQLLICGGAVNIKATMNGQPVFATGGYNLYFKQPKQSDQPMALFQGYPVVDSTGISIFWATDTSNTVEQTYLDSTKGNQHFYAFDSCLKLNWINCDYFYSTTAPKTDITLVAPDTTYNLSNTRIFVVFKAINSVAGMSSYEETTHSFNLGTSGYFIPIGATVDIIVLGAKKNTYFMDVRQDLTVTQNMLVDFTPTPQTLGTIQATLSNL